MKIAFIGLGNMGGPMAHNLHKAGHEVRAFDLSQPARDKLAADGVPIAADAKAAVQGAEVVITMLPASQHVEGLFLGAGDLLAQLPAGTLIIDCSTIAAATSRKVAEAAKAKGVAFIDAPVSGGTGGAGAMSSGRGTSGMPSWCSAPGSSSWNEAAQKKITLPCWIAVTRRTEKLPPSRVRSTS